MSVSRLDVRVRSWRRYDMPPKFALLERRQLPLRTVTFTHQWDTRAPVPLNQTPHPVDAIVDQALDLVAAGGLAELTLRPLAAKLGVSVPVISARMGSKEQLLERVTEAAHARDALFFDRWLARAHGVGPMDAAARAALSDLALREWVGVERRQVILLIELVHEYALRPDRSPALEAWLQEAGRFWSSLLFGEATLADFALGYMLDEAGFSLSVGDNPLYVLLRTLGLQRLAGGMFPRGEGEVDTASALIALLQPPAPPFPEILDPKRQLIADRAADLIVSTGIERVTHRSVALAAGMPASTVVYHFGARGALVVAGLHTIIARFSARERAGREGDAMQSEASTQDLIKATSMIALAAVREPSLAPYALDMRRRRGENVRGEDLSALGLGIGARSDRMAAQVLSVAVFGMGMVGMACGSVQSENYGRAFAAFEAWRTRSAG